MNYVILAAGEGSRFVNEGIDTPKPLVPILGEPMIGRLMRVLESCSAKKIVVVSNSKMPSLTSYLGDFKKTSGLDIDIRPIVSHSSFYSLLCGAEGLAGRFIAMTVDTIFPIDEFRAFVGEVECMADDEVVMGLTRFVDDESPLYAKIGIDGYVIDYKYGGDPFPGDIIVSAGIYGLTSEAMEVVKARDTEPESLSDFQRVLAAETEIKVKVFEFSRAMDVDRVHDQSVAERFILQFESKNSE